MKKHLNSSLTNFFTMLLLTLPISVSANNHERHSTRPIIPIHIEAKVMSMEDTSIVIIQTPISRDVRGILLGHEISRKNYGTVKRDGDEHYVLRVGLYGISDNSDIEVVESIIKGNTYNMSCQSVTVGDPVNTIPLCQILINGEDLFLEMMRHPMTKSSINLSTRLIHPSLDLHEQYEKVIGNLLISNF